VSARDRSVAEIFAMARTLPVMAPRRLVEVRDAGSIRESDHEIVGAYLDKPAPETVVMLLFADIDLRDKLVKLVDRGAVMCRFDHPKEREMPQHVQRRAKRMNLRMGRDAIDALAAIVGADLTLLERALEKLALVAEQGEVTSQMVATHVADTHLEDAFAFVRSIATAQRGAALKALGALQAAREEPLRLLGLIAWQMRQVARARALMDQGSTAQQAATELNLFGDRKDAVIGAAKRFDMKGHAARLSRIAETDQDLKGSRVAPWLVMSRLVLDLCPADVDGAPARSPRR
jgi:DNA polymerase III subunit delta